VLGTYVDVDAGPILEFSRSQHVPFNVAEREILGIDHAEVGSLLLEHWNLPPTLSEIVRWHHEPESCPHQSDTLDLVHLASHLSLLSGQLGFTDGLQYRVSEKVVARRRLRGREWEFAMCRASARLVEVERDI
jgi:HD-like signal output (HDOD) protein